MNKYIMDTTISMNSNEKLKSFIGAVNTQIDERVEKLLKEAETERVKILSRAEIDSKISAEKHFADSFKKHGNQYMRDISKAELSIKKEILRHRETLTDKVFAVVEEKIIEYKKTPKYIDYLIKTLIMMNISGNCEIFVCPEDMKLADTLKKAVKASDVVFTADENIRLGGLSVYNKNKGTITDKTFDLAIEEQKQTFTNSNAFIL